MKVLWTEPAEDELAAVFEYVTERTEVRGQVRSTLPLEIFLPFGGAEDR